jgi:hypothetical protein
MNLGCRKITEVVGSVHEERPPLIMCPKCGYKARLKFGVPGIKVDQGRHYNSGLRQWVGSDKEVDSVADKQGLVRVENLDNKHWFEDRMEKFEQQQKELDAADGGV